MAAIDSGTLPSNFVPSKPKKRAKPKQKPKGAKKPAKK